MLIEEQKADEVIETPEETVVETPVVTEETTVAKTPVEEEEVSVTIEGVTPPQDEVESAPAPEWVKELRKSYRELQREKRELEERLKATQKVETNPTLGPKPTLESVDYDADKFEAELEAWHLRKKAFDQEQQAIEEQQKKQQAEWNKKLTGYSERKTALKVSDFEDAESAVLQTLDTIKQGIILQGANEPALLVYALGKNPAKLKELAAISDPVQFAFEIARLETKIKTAPKKTAPPPEKPVLAGTASVSSSDAMLERLREEADRTGDFSKVVAYKRQLKSQ